MNPTKFVTIEGYRITSNNPITVRTRMHGSGSIVKQYKTLKPKQAMCSGCREDFYNYGGNSTTGRCWAFDDAKVVDKVGYSWIGRDNGPDTLMRKTLTCWHAVVK